MHKTQHDELEPNLKKILHRNGMRALEAIVMYLHLPILGKFQFFVKFGVIFKETIGASRIIHTGKIDKKLLEKLKYQENLTIVP